MSLPTPDDLANAPRWDNYVVAQAVQASLALIPPHTLAYGVAVDGAQVRLVFQLSEAAEQDSRDINEIWENLEALVGHAVEVTAVQEIRQVRDVLPLDGVRWIFLARTTADLDV